MNAHDDYNSHHISHMKHDTLFSLVKRIFLFVSDQQEVKPRLKELTKCLLSYYKPDSFIDKVIFNTRSKKRFDK